MKIDLIAFSSVLQNWTAEDIEQAHQMLFEALRKEFDIRLILSEDYSRNYTEDADAVLVLVSTGGTEGQIVARYDDLPHPLVLLTDGLANSLAASLELSCWVRQRGEKCQIIHGDIPFVINSIRETARRKILKDSRIGVIGKPSDWLVSSGVDYSLARERWGVEYVDIPLSLVEEEYSRVPEKEVILDSERFLKEAAGCVEPGLPEVIKAMRLYQALLRISCSYRLDALTIQCFSLIPAICTTGCLALSLLNDRGIVAGCEGDLQSIFTMLLAKRLLGKDGFMANPAQIDTRNNRILFAHCTIGLRQCSSYIARSHFESQSGVAIQGILREGQYTIAKCGGKGLDQFKVLRASLLENQSSTNRCRTQILLQIEKPSSVDYFLTGSIGNHHIIIEGDYYDDLCHFLDF